MGRDLYMSQMRLASCHPKNFRFPKCFGTRTRTNPEIMSLVNSAPVVIFSKSYCPYCDMAKHAIVPIVPENQFKVYELDYMQDGLAIQNQIGKISGIHTVPQVFVNGKFIGDGTTVSKMGRSGELRRLLVQAGIVTDIFLLTGSVLCQMSQLQNTVTQILPEPFEEIIEFAEPPSPFSILYYIWSAAGWLSSLKQLSENVRSARVNFLERVDEALTKHTFDMEELGFPSPLIQGMAEVNSRLPIPILLPDIPFLGPLNPYGWSTE